MLAHSGVVFVEPVRLLLSSKSLTRLLACVVTLAVCRGISAQTNVGGLPSGVPNLTDPFISQLALHAQWTFDETNRREKKSSEQRRAQYEKLIESGVLSALDLDAPNNAVAEYNRAISLMNAQNSKEAIKHLQKAVKDCPTFVSAHMSLGLAYVDQDDTGRAVSEFEAAAKLDDRFPGSFLNLGLLALSREDFATAQSELEKASSLSPTAKILSALTNAQYGNHQYKRVLETTPRVHALEHKGMASVHYMAASAAMALNDLEAMERELGVFLSEDPTSAFAPFAHQDLAALIHKRTVQAADASNPQPSQGSQTLADTERLKAELSAVGDESDGGTCDDCDPKGGSSGAASHVAPGLSSPAIRPWTVRKNVDEVAMLFAVSNHGHAVNDLGLSDIHIRDNNKPPKKVLQFTSQSKLPLRLALVLDTSGSVRYRFSFEKRAAAKFVEEILNSTSDLGYVAGFAEETTVTQDFSSDSGELGKGIEKLTDGGGTALFDAVSSACWKLAAYPESERVARVLVILSDGEDNSSNTSLKQSIRVAEETGVTIYTISTSSGDKTVADKVLELLAERSGGEAMFPGYIRNLDSSFDKLRDVIRSRYFVAYRPADFQPNGSYRTISVIADKDGKRLQVRTRKGYHARLETSPN
jgi:Ca-activated chloride channel family protein